MLAIILCSIPLSGSELNDPPFGKVLITASVALPTLFLMGANWGAFFGCSLCYQFGKQPTKRPIADDILPKPFKLGDTTVPNPTYALADIIGLFGGAYAACHVSMSYLVRPGECIRTIAVISALSITHILTYPLAKRALQWHIDRSYRTAPIDDDAPPVRPIPQDDLRALATEIMRLVLISNSQPVAESSDSSTSSQRSEEDQISTPSETSETTNSSDVDPDLPSHSTDDYGMTENYETGHYTARVHNLRQLRIHSTRDF